MSFAAESSERTANRTKTAGNQPEDRWFDRLLLTCWLPFREFTFMIGKLADRRGKILNDRALRPRRSGTAPAGNLRTSDPTRREILAVLRRGDRSTGDLAERFPMTRPAVSRHLRVLYDAGLVDRKERLGDRECR